MLNKISSYVFYVLMAITLVVCGMFYLGGEETVATTAGDTIAPENTSVLIGWAYALIIVAAVATLAYALYTFVTKLTYNVKSVITPIVSVVAVGALLLATYFGADTTPIAITGYEGSQEPWVYQLSNMCIVSAVVLAVIAIIVTILGFAAKYLPNKK